MKLVLVQERGGEQLPELSFDENVVAIGRDAENCQIYFDQANFPMVSRKHAEIRWNNGNWFLIDTNSSYGTFLEGQKISQPQALQIGNRFQIGTDGPIFRVVWFEVEKEISQDMSFAATEVDMPKPIPQIVSQPQVSQEVKPINSVPQLKFKDDARADFPIIKQNIWFGRNPDCDIVFDSSKQMISRKHAEIRQENGQFILQDNQSFNGTFLNKEKISGSVVLKHNDEIQLGIGGPILFFQTFAEAQNEEKVFAKTMVVSAGEISDKIKSNEFDNPQLLKTIEFIGKDVLTIGRGNDCDINLDGLQISNQHARLTRTNQGISVEDLGSTNGTYINGKRISRAIISLNDAVQIGSFLIKISQTGKVGIFDTRSKTRIDAVNITKEVKNRAGGGKIRLLDEVSLSIQPNEFIGLLGPSGAGKSTFMDALNGMRPASSGNVLVNNLDLYQHLDSIKQSIGYVPQDDIMHRELTVYRTLYYVAKLRLSSDISGKEIEQIISEVLEVTGLSERRNVPINQLSGGQRKRVSIAIELITKPSVIFLDEPTSGLDPATEEKIMKLFRQIAESGRTVILTTHAMENVKLFDKIVVLMRGKLVFYGKPEEALSHFKSASFKDLYDKLEEPIEVKLKQNPSANRHQVTEEVAENWKVEFMRTSNYRANVYEPLKDIGNKQSSGVQKKRRLGLFGTVRQTLTLSRRYFEVLLRDKFNLFILLAQAPIIALLTFLVMDNNYPRDMLFFILSLVAIWFGTSVAAREIIRERPVYTRERMVNLGLFPYLASKLFVLGVIICVQCFLLFIPLKFFDLVGLMKMQGEFAGIPQFWAMLLTAGVGLAIGLFISAMVKTSEMATSLVPLILIPQILFSGLIGVPSGISKVVGLTMPATWSFDTMKRFSTLDTLKEEGADERSDELGLYKFIEKKNDKIIADAKKDIDNYKKDAEDKISESMRNGQKPTLDDPPKPKDAVKLPKDLSEYVNFLHPWMHEVLNQIVLMFMFLSMCILTLIVLKLQDIN